MCARACMRVCMRVRMIAGQHKRGEHDNRKMEEHQQHGKPAYICKFATDEKKLKKIWKYEKAAVSLYP